jgi:hypothetical protein
VRLRGAGLSERRIGPLSLDTFAEDLDAVLPALDLDRVALVAAVHQSEHGLPASTQHLREDRTSNRTEASSFAHQQGLTASTCTEPPAD